MKTSDISDFEVLSAFVKAKEANKDKFVGKFFYDFIDAPEKLCYKAAERCEKRLLIEVGVSLRDAWLTKNGQWLYDSTVRTLNDSAKFISNMLDITYTQSGTFASNDKNGVYYINDIKVTKEEYYSKYPKNLIPVQ